MGRVKVVVWDNIGNTMLGIRPWENWLETIRSRLEAEIPDSRSRIVSLGRLFPDHDIELVWLYDPVTSQRGFRAVFDEFGARLVDTSNSDAIVTELRNADFLILHKETLAAEALERATGLRLIQHLGLDHRGVPMAAARAQGIPVAATPLVNYSAVAEHVWGMILVDCKRMVDQREHMRSRGYLDAWGAYHPGVRVVSDLTLGLVGLGEIARPVARIARAFGMRTVYWDLVRFPDQEDHLDIRFAAWDDLFAVSDIVSLHLALNPATEGIIGPKEFARMKPDALFVNTARGKLVDETALADALESGALRAAAIDAFAEEPLPATSRLLALHDTHPQRVILTPHSAAQGPWTWIRDSQELWFNIRRVLDGEPVAHLIDE
jgi:phosphoglycerate dehydrogenase-like enzyme